MNVKNNNLFKVLRVTLFGIFPATTRSFQLKRFTSKDYVTIAEEGQFSLVYGKMSNKSENLSKVVRVALFGILFSHH